MRVQPSLRVRRSGGLKAERVFLPNRKDRSCCRRALARCSCSSACATNRTGLRSSSSEAALEAELRLDPEELPGIGPGKRRALLAALGSLRAVREAPLDVIAGVPGISRRDAQTIAGFFAAMDK